MDQIQPLWSNSKATSQPGVFSMDTLTVPFVVDGVLDHWPSGQWTVDSLAQALGNKPLRCRLMQLDQDKRDGPAWEAEGVYVECQLHEFSAWCRGEAAEDSPLAAFSPQEFSGYIDYKYMCDIFADHPHMLKEVQWSSLGLSEKDGQDSTIWIGSRGACTPCHYDTYGFNMVAQIEGRKRWVLFPPGQSCHLYPTRVPYEESSVFSQVDLSDPDLCRFPDFRKATPVVVTLEAGQVLYVPRQWWHYVTCEETAISINTWVEVAEDDESRAQEAVTRLLASSLIPYLSQTAGAHLQDFWINPTEELEEAACNVQYLKAALSSVAPPPSTEVTDTPLNTHHQSDASHNCKEKSSMQLPEETGHTSSQQTTKETATCSSASEKEHLPCQSTGEETDGQKSVDIKKARQTQDLEMVVESEGSPRSGDGVFVPSGLLSRVGRTLQGSAVIVVDSPFCLSQFFAKRQQEDSTCLQKHDDSVMMKESPNSHASSVKRKNVDCNSGDSLDIQGDTTLRCSTSGNFCNTDAETVVQSDFSPERKRVCIGENNQSANITTSQQGEIENAQVSTESLYLFPQILRSQISVYSPQPCHIQKYIGLLETKDWTERGDVRTDKEGKDEKEVGVDTCSTPRHETQPAMEEAVLRSVLHPDVVNLIVSKLKEQV